MGLGVSSISPGERTYKRAVILKRHIRSYQEKEVNENQKKIYFGFGISSGIRKKLAPSMDWIRRCNQRIAAVTEQDAKDRSQRQRSHQCQQEE